jgi:hypothetical protein
MDSIGKNSSRKLYPGGKEEISIFLGYLQIQSAHIADIIEMEGGWNNQNGGRWGGGGVRSREIIIKKERLCPERRVHRGEKHLDKV